MKHKYFSGRSVNHLKASGTVKCMQVFKNYATALTLH
jgi:hypothetical protein